MRRQYLPVLDSREAAQWDQLSISAGITSTTLMSWAAYAVFQEITQLDNFNNYTDIHILTGPGNNGGDGYALAWLLGASVDKNIFIWKFQNPATIDSKYFAEICTKIKSANISIEDISMFQPINLSHTSIIIDAIYGIGLNKNLPDQIQKIITLINRNKKSLKIAIDISTGLSADGAIFSNEPFKADITITFGAYKIGHLIEPGILFTGKIIVKPVGFISQLQPPRRLISPVIIIPPLRKEDSHKYKNGVAHIFGGSSGMEGAAIMAAYAFLALGGGLAKIYTTSPDLKNILSILPELMVISNNDPEKIEALYLDALQNRTENSTCIIGPGKSEILSSSFWKTVLNIDIKIIIDGSSLKNIYLNKDLFKKQKSATLIFTPHLSEAESLLQKKISNIREAALEIVNNYNTHIYFKGPGGLITFYPYSEEVFVNSKEYQLSTGGTGDILCGVIANMLVRKMPVEKALESAVYLYSKSATKVTTNYTKNNKSIKDFLLPSELIEELRKTMTALTV